MKMAKEIRLPRLGWSMEEGTFQGWLKQNGVQVQVGDALFEVEGEKALQEVAALDAGILHIPPDAPKPGTTLPVGALLGYVLAAGEPLPDVPEHTGTTSGNLDLPAQPKIPSTPHAPPSVRRLARELKVPLASLLGKSSTGRITADDVRERANAPATLQTAAQVASPRARRSAKANGIDWTRLKGTGKNGRVREADIRAAMQSSLLGYRANSVGADDSTGGAELEAVQALPTDIVTLSPRRKAIAARMRISRERTVPVTLTAVADASNLVSLRNQFKEATAKVPVPAYTDILAWVVAGVLRHHRLLAARWNDDASTLQVPNGNAFNIGIAVNTPEGLLVPVIRNVGQVSFAETVATSRDLIQRARSGRLTVSEMQDGMFTITSLGAYGIDAFTPVINYPEVAILGVGKIHPEPVVSADGHVISGDRLTLSLTFDHCAIDGAPAAAFLRDICHALEAPAPHLLRDIN